MTLASVLHLRSARYNWDQSDTTAVTWSRCPYTVSLASFCIPAPFTSASRCIYRDLDLAVTLLYRRLGCCWGPTACRAQSTFQVSQNTIPKMQQRVNSFLIDDNQHLDSKDTERIMRNGAEITAETVNTIVDCNTNHHTMTFPFLIHRGLNDSHFLFGAQPLCERW